MPEMTLYELFIATGRERPVTTVLYISYSSGVATPLSHEIATWVGEIVSQQYNN